MAEDSQHPELAYYLQVPESLEGDLVVLRSMANLKVAWHAEHIWLTGFTEEQIIGVEAASLPRKMRFYRKEHHLFKLGGKLPERRMPEGLLWTPIIRAFKIETGGAEDNYDLDLPPLSIGLNIVEHRKNLPETILMRLTAAALGKYLAGAPRIRTAHLSWCLLGEKEVLVFGKPLLPVPAKEVYWRNGLSFLPLGYDFTLQQMATVVARQQNSDADWLLWGTDNSYVRIAKNSFKPLSLSSFRKTFSDLSVIS